MKTAAAFALVALSGAICAQRPLVIQSETKLVVVDVVVTDKKGYVHGLTAKDFRVWEDSKEQTIQSFTEEATAAAQSAVSQVDHLVLMFDYGGMDAGDQIRARQAANRFIDANVGPNRRMAVANFDGGLRVAQSFTDNAGRLKDAVSGAKSGIVSVNNAQAGTSATTDLSSRSLFPALRGLAANLGSVPGRKTIVLLTGSALPSNDQRSALAAAIETCNRANVAVYPIDVRDVALPATFDATQRGAAPAGRQMGRNNRGPANDTDPSAASDPAGASQQILLALANGTGGFLIRNASELPGGLQKIGEEQQEYYLLGYTPPESKEGACHALRVKVDHPGVTIRARSSYCSGKQPDLVTAKPAEQKLEQLAKSDSTSIAGSMQLPFFYGATGVARVNLALEIPLELTAKNSQKRDIDVLGIASTADGGVAARFTDTVSVSAGPVHYEKEFRIAPGQYRFTLALGSGGASLGKLEQPLVIEPYESGQLAVSAIALGRQVRKPGTDAASSDALFDDRTPMSVGGVELIPTGSNVFRTSEQAFCYFEIYGTPGASGSARVRILDPKTGQFKWDSGPSKVDFPADKSTLPAGLSVPISSLAPGQYELEVLVADGTGKSVRRMTTFEIK